MKPDFTHSWEIFLSRCLATDSLLEESKVELVFLCGYAAGMNGQRLSKDDQKLWQDLRQRIETLNLLFSKYS